MQEPFVYIIVVNYQQWQDSCECLDSIFRLQYTHYRVILVDNNSPNDSIERMVDWAGKNKIYYSLSERRDFEKNFDPVSAPALLIVKNDQNNGFASANNLVLKLVSRTNAYTWLINPDMIVEPGSLTELVNFAENLGQDTITGSTILNPGGKINFYGGGRLNYLFARVIPAKTTQAIGELDYISGTSLFTAASNFQKFGLLPEEYFLYWEETDWCYRAKKNGAKLAVCKESVCTDKGSTTIGKGFLAHYYYCRNGLFFISKYRKGNLFLALISMGFRFLKRLVKGEWGIARGIFKGTLDFIKKRHHAIQ